MISPADDPKPLNCQRTSVFTHGYPQPWDIRRNTLHPGKGSLSSYVHTLLFRSAHASNVIGACPVTRSTSPFNLASRFCEASISISTKTCVHPSDKRIDATMPLNCSGESLTCTMCWPKTLLKTFATCKSKAQHKLEHELQRITKNRR